jgi:hypothetical protein
MPEIDLHEPGNDRSRSRKVDYAHSEPRTQPLVNIANKTLGD